MTPTHTGAAPSMPKTTGTQALLRQRQTLQALQPGACVRARARANASGAPNPLPNGTSYTLLGLTQLQGPLGPPAAVVSTAATHSASFSKVRTHHRSHCVTRRRNANCATGRMGVGWGHPAALYTPAFHGWPTRAAHHPRVTPALRSEARKAYTIASRQAPLAPRNAAPFLHWGGRVRPHTISNGSLPSKGGQLAAA
jgi:hypothetical protein